MATVAEWREKELARLEAERGADDPFVKALKRGRDRRKLEEESNLNHFQVGMRGREHPEDLQEVNEVKSEVGEAKNTTRISGGSDF